MENEFRAGRDEELGLAVAPLLERQMAAAIDQRSLRVLEATYRIAARLPANAGNVPSDLINELTDGFADKDRAAVMFMLKLPAPHRSAHRLAEHVLRQLSGPVTERTISDARVPAFSRPGRRRRHARTSQAIHSPSDRETRSWRCSMTMWSRRFAEARLVVPVVPTAF